ncbi:MAG: tetratricopeptide repeat protein [Geminicoccaceae bacterium]
MEEQIWAIWAEIDDSEGRTLLETGTDAMQRRAYGRALESFNALVVRDPEFAEGWNKRATLFYLMGDYKSSVLDIEKTLALEPRHFGALSGLGLIYIAVDKPEAAIRSFEAALAIYPKLASAKAHVDMLRAMTAGDPT